MTAFCAPARLGCTKGRCRRLSHAVELGAGAGLLWLAVAAAHAQAPVATAGQGAPQAAQAHDAAPASQPRDIQQWLMRLHEGSRSRGYVGTFVVSSPGGALSSARIWHVCEGTRQMERVDALSGTPRTTLRDNDAVMTFLPQSKVARSERREGLGLFPKLLNAGDHAIGEFYTAHKTGSERTAGYDADIVLLQPRDDLRFGYRIWSEKKTGLAIKVQTLSTGGQVLEQVAFSELQLDAPVRMDVLAQAMQQTEGWQVQKADAGRATTAEAEGWVQRQSVPGFRPVGCYRRAAAAGAREGALQWVFSDGLATVSLFIEQGERRNAAEGLTAMGATHSLTVALPAGGAAGWLTAVGEVPAATLRAFAHSLQRKH